MKNKNNTSQQDIDFIQDSKAAMLAKTTPYANVLLYLLGLFIIIMAIWTTIGKLDEVTRGVATVVPSSKVQIIQNLEGGIIAKILVTEGEQVKQGQPIAKLDATQFASKYHEAYMKYVTLQAESARLKAEVNDTSMINFPVEVQNHPEISRLEQQLFITKRQAFANDLKNMQESYRLAKKELNITETLAKEGIMSQVELLRAKREMANLKTRIDSYKSGYYKELLMEQNKTKGQLSIMQETLKSLQDRMQRTTIYAPVSGIVKQIHINTQGGVVQPGHPIMEIVPLNDQLIVETRIKPADIAFIKRGQKAKVKISAYDYSIYGGLNATVTHISADTSQDERGNPYYEVDLKTAKNYLGSKEGSLAIIPGMTAQVDIMTGKKAILSYLLKPLLRAKEKAMRER